MAITTAVERDSPMSAAGAFIDLTAVSTPEPGSFFLLFVGLATQAFCANRKMDNTRRLA